MRYGKMHIWGVVRNTAALSSVTGRFGAPLQRTTTRRHSRSGYAWGSTGPKTLLFDRGWVVPRLSRSPISPTQITRYRAPPLSLEACAPAYLLRCVATESSWVTSPLVGQR